MITAHTLREHFLAGAPWVNPASTVDTVKAGDGNRPVQCIGVGWIASLENLHAAAALGCELFITHEPVFYDHYDGPDCPGRHFGPGKTKQRFLDTSGMVVLRCHDAWDLWPEIGNRDAWMRWLELGTPFKVDSSGHALTSLVGISPTPLRDFAAHVARKAAVLGEDSVAVVGDPERLIHTVAVGVGCAVPRSDLVAAGADLVLATYDGAAEWRQRQELLDSGVALITVEHGTNEKPGMIALADYLREQFPDLTVHYIDQKRIWRAGT